MEEKKEKTTARKFTQAGKDVRNIMKLVNRAAREHKAAGGKVAWAMRGTFHEPVRATDIRMTWPEPYSSLYSAKKLEAPVLAKARGDGFSQFSCGYCEVGLGYASLMAEAEAIPEGAPDGGMPYPDMLLSANLLCDSRQKFFQVAGRYLDVPYYQTDFVFPTEEGEYGDDITMWDELKYMDPKEYVKRRGWEHYIRYVMEEIKRLIAWLEQQTGKKMDYDELQERVHYEMETHRLWFELQELRKAVPCPLPAGDHLSIFYPFWWYPAELETMEFFRRARDEIWDRVQNKISVVPDEKYRLLWASGVPFWHSMYLFNYFEDKFGAVVVMDDPYYAGKPIPEFSDPIETIAYHWVTNEGYQIFAAMKPERIIKWINEYKIDGLLWHQTMSCRVATVGSLYTKHLVEQRVKLPSLFLESDLVDSSTFNEAEFKTRIDAFMDAVITHKESRRQI